MIRRLFPALAILCCSVPALAAVRVQISGDIAGQEKENVEARLSVREEGKARDLDEGQVRRLARKGRGQILQSLQPYGYYNPEIELDISGEAPDWVVKYRITLGPVTRISDVDVQITGEGKDFPSITGTAARLSLQKDRRLVHADYEWSKGKLIQAAYANGFLDARWLSSELRVDSEQNTAVAVLHLDTGVRYFFGPVTIEQQGLKPELIQRYVTLREGDPFDSTKLLAFQFVLSDLDYFQSVEIIPQRDAVDERRRVPVLVRTTPRLGKRYDLGVGYGTDTGARASFGTEWRRLNESGHKLRTDVRVSELKNTLSAEYRIPRGHVPGDSLSFNAANESEKLEDGKTLKYLIGTSLNRQKYGWQRRLYLEFLHEETDFDNKSASADPAEPEAPAEPVTPDISADLLTPGVSFTRTSVDDTIYARRGWYFFIDVHAADRDALSTASFVQTHAVARAVYPLGARARLLGRGEFGATFVADFDELPASQRFFAGGDQSVRGYAYQSIGPTDSEGKVIGGKYLTTMSIEAEVRVVGNWGAATFLDAGGADDKPGPRLFTGVGVGLRYRAPIGSLQFDLAHPMGGDESGIRIHIGVRVGL